MTPDLEAFTFRGEADIEVTTQDPTSRILMNAVELDITEAHVTLEDGRVLEADITLDEDLERVTLALEQNLPPGPATVSLRFSGTLNDQLRGFYRSHYTTPEGDDRYMATTQFEATDARRAFPCWDEPARKATFDVTLVVPSGMVAVANTPVAGEKDRHDGTKEVRFAETPRMSTYLLAFVVGDLATVEGAAKDGTQVRVVTVRGKEELGRYALKSAEQLLNYFNDYFGIPYPLPKLDHLALPDFAAGAMENWGAITYRERLLLYDPEESSTITRQFIFDIMAHEIAHMWFGDLVTMEWWDDLWLNESFASWIGTKAVAELHPEWSMWTQFLYQDTAGGLTLDGLRSSHPIEVPVHNPAEIREIFDSISYNKGASVLWMLETFLGPEDFRKGLRQYMDAHAYGNARTEDLWKALEEASGQPVRALMASWIRQTGFPLLEVASRRDDGDLSLGLTQNRFLYENLEGPSADDTVWKVPVSVQRGGAERVAFLAEERSVDRTLPPPPEGGADWVKVNAGQTGFYRVNYPPDEWERLAAALRSRGLPALDRLGLQSDAYALMRAGYAPATLYLSLTQAFEEETDSTIWREMAANLRSFEILIADEPYLPEFQGYVRRLFRSRAEHLGWDARPDEGHLDALMRSAVLGRLAVVEDPETLAEGLRRFEAYRDDPTALSPDLKEVVYPIAGQEGDEATYEALWDLERAADLNEEKLRLLTAVTRPKSPDLLRRSLERSLQEDEVRIQDTPFVIVGLAGNRFGRDLAWDFVRENWAELDRRYSKGGFAIGRIVGITDAFTTLERAEEVEAFFEAHPTPAANRRIQQALERIRLNRTWLTKNRASLADWLASA
ncbi:MAG: M1 family metallopeptidase [Thermoplasmata archaeon]|nr:M1 family metallopeptidase [Thermoplasmata archaeon]